VNLYRLLWSTIERGVNIGALRFSRSGHRLQKLLTHYCTVQEVRTRSYSGAKVCVAEINATLSSHLNNFLSARDRDILCMCRT
jgi:hypothetical protein